MTFIVIYVCYYKVPLFHIIHRPLLKQKLPALYHSMDLVTGFLFGPVYQTYRYVALIEMKLKISGAINCELECKYLQFGDYDQLSFLSHLR